MASQRWSAHTHFAEGVDDISSALLSPGSTMGFQNSLTRFLGRKHVQRPSRHGIATERDISPPRSLPHQQQPLEQAEDSSPISTRPTPLTPPSNMSETPRPVGLLELAAPEDAAVDIVFVHGLTGHREKTWRGRYGTDWTKTLLPKDLPNARILTWGYDANILHFFDKKSENQLNDHSKQLCADLAGARTKNPDWPILFVVHSLGGIVCENALILATISADAHIKQISACTRGIIFLGTPLEGSSKTIWVEIAHKFASLIGQAKNRDLISVLEKNAPRLQQLADGFSNILRDRAKTEKSIEVVFFYEEFATGPLGHIVTKDSATVQGLEAQAIPADHTGMVQFDTNAEPGYVRIKAILARWIQDLKPKDKAAPAPAINVHQEIDRMLGGLVAGVINGSPNISSNIYDSDKRGTT